MMTVWTFPRHRDYERALRDVAAAWFASRGFVVSLLEDSICIMTSYYQFFREALMALELGGDFVLLCDRRSPTFAYGDTNTERGMMPFLLSLLPDSAIERIAVITIQDVVEAIRATGRHEWVSEFEAKYGLNREVVS